MAWLSVFILLSLLTGNSPEKRLSEQNNIDYYQGKYDFFNAYLKNNPFPSVSELFNVCL